MNLEKMYITDEEVNEIVKSLNFDEENSSKNAVMAQLILLTDIRRFLRHINKNINKECNCQKVYTQPTENKEDIIVGNIHYIK